MGKHIRVFLKSRSVAYGSRFVTKLGEDTEEMVVRCIALDVQGGEHGSSRKTVTSWRFKSSGARTTRRVYSDRVPSDPKACPICAA